MLDSGATSDVCFNHASFVELKPIWDVYVTLRDHTRILVQYIGRVKLTSHIVLDNIL